MHNFPRPSTATVVAGRAIVPGRCPECAAEALASGAYRAEPPAEVVGHGLAAIPEGLRRLRKGVSARKLVVIL